VVKVRVQSGFLSHEHTLISVVATDQWRCQSSVAPARYRRLWDVRQCSGFEFDRHGAP